MIAATSSSGTTLRRKIALLPYLGAERHRDQVERAVVERQRQLPAARHRQAKRVQKRDRGRVPRVGVVDEACDLEHEAAAIGRWIDGQRARERDAAAGTARPGNHTAAASGS